MKIVELSTESHRLDTAINYFWTCWGNEHNFRFYADCITHSLDGTKRLPKFYLGIHDDRIIASYALLTNDVISRQDLCPWLACLFVNPEHRNKGLAGQLLDHGLNETRNKGFDTLFLSTDIADFYEKKGWRYLANGFNVLGNPIKIYEKFTG